MSSERILAVKLADLGDLLLSEPALRSLSAGFPDARIDVLTTPASAALLAMFPQDYGCLTFAKHEFDVAQGFMTARAPLELAEIGIRLRRSGYDAVVILHHLTTPAGALKFQALSGATGAPIVAGLDNGRGTFLTHRQLDRGFGAAHEVEYMLGVALAAGGAPVDPAPHLRQRDPDQVSKDVSLPASYAAIFPVTGPFAPGRNWPAESFAELAQALACRGITPAVLGAEDARAAATQIVQSEPQALDLTGRTSLEQLRDIVAGARVTVTGDSFPGHLARAVGSPVVSIFGPSNHLAWMPYVASEAGSSTADDAIVVRHDVPCSPCLYTGYRLGRRSGCPVRTCLARVTVDDVMAAVDQILGSES